MKKTFDWYFHPTKEEIDSAWKSGILTVDTNVLLDLYRYHESTRDSLILGLQRFEGKKWLSYQACQEFFRNRTKVIVSSNQTFKQAQEELEKLSKSLDSSSSQLKGNRIIPTHISDKLLEEVSAAINKAQSEVQAAKEKYPKYLQDDPILHQLSILFNESIGEGFKKEDIDVINKIAEERKQNKIPPGYLDEDKDDDRPYGDYFLWRQIMECAKAEQSPVILVTSERKEDWWEKISGITTGPRPELLKEAREYSGQRILIYQTERFLEYALQRFNQPVNSVAIEEIRAVSALRFEMEIAVQLNEQKINECTDSKNTGTLDLQLRRPVWNFTVSGHFDPHMQNVPLLNVRLISAPDAMPKYKMRAGTGTVYDFNVHVMSEEHGVRLPLGPYSFAYEANCDTHSLNSDIECNTKI